MLRMLFQLMGKETAHVKNQILFFDDSNLNYHTQQAKRNETLITYELAWRLYIGSDMKKLLIIDRTIRKSIGNICKNTVYPFACCCNEEKSTTHKQIIKEKTEKYRYIGKVHTDHHHHNGITAWFSLDLPKKTS